MIRNTKTQILRGLKSDLPMLDDGELGYGMDAKELYIGTDYGNVLVTGNLDPDNLTKAVPVEKGGTGATTVAEAIDNLGALAQTGDASNVVTNFTESDTVEELTSGEKLGFSLGKIQTAIRSHKQHIEDFSNPHDVTKVQIGLGDVDNTPDEQKPVSRLQQDEIDLKYQKAVEYTDENIASVIEQNEKDVQTLNAAIAKKADEVELSGHINNSTIHVTSSDKNNWNTHIQNVSGNPHKVTKAQVGLGNVDNTSDVNKPISRMQQEELDKRSQEILNLVKELEEQLVGLIENVRKSLSYEIENVRKNLFYEIESIREELSNKVNDTLIWSETLSAVPGSGTGVSISDSKGKVLNFNNSSHAGRYRVDLITNTTAADASSSYLVMFRSDGSIVNVIMQGAATRAPRLYVSEAGYLKVRTNGHTATMTVGIAITKLG